ncbi:MAG: SRPBCC family protein [Anaerolineae bacterium]|nr:SRPBCC family protein [Anaerolineae bacterium]
MTLIDRRIVINAPPDAVWRILTDPQQMAAWHAGYDSVSVLSTTPTGVGARRRCSLIGGKAVIEEITAWVEGWGYEYIVLDGPFRSFQGRLRLQAVPEGTNVTWTVSYRRKGVFGGVRDILGGRRALLAVMADSLRRLCQTVQALGLKVDDDHRSKVMMRSRLDADARAQYQRRYPPPPEVEAKVQTPPAPQESVVMDEQPVPNGGDVPSFVADLTRGSDTPDYSYTADTEPKAPPGLREAIAAQQQAAAQQAAAEPDTTPEDRQPVPAADVAAGSKPVVPPEHAAFARPDDAVEPESEKETDPVRPMLPPDIAAAGPSAAPPDEREVSAEISPVPVDAEIAPGDTDATRDTGELEGVRDEQHTTPPRGIPVAAPAEISPAALVDEESNATRKTPPRGIPSVTLPLPASITPPVPVPAVIKPPPLDADSALAEEDKQRAGLPPPVPKTDTGEFTIWDIFGMQRPSDADQKALADLMKSVKVRRQAMRRQYGYKHQRIVRVRRLHVAFGLRLGLAFRTVRVRLRRSPAWDSELNEQ